MRRAKKKSLTSPLEGCEDTSDDGDRLADRFPLRRRPDEQVDQRIERISLRQIDAALEGGLDQATDNLRATDRLAVLQADVNG
jgi:hypothetical protein